MANTTFNGPVRSEAGFLEWDGTAWAPVQGGGGGGVTVIPYEGVGGTATIDLPAVTEVGQTFEYIGGYGARNSSNNIVVNWPVIPGVDSYAATGSYIADSGVANIGGSPGGFGFPVQGALWRARVAYLGTFLSNGLTYGIFQFTVYNFGSAH